MGKANINIANLHNSITSITNFCTTLNMVATDNIETGGLDVIIPVINNSLTGQALSATIIEAQNNLIFSAGGIVTDSYTSNTTII